MRFAVLLLTTGLVGVSAYAAPRSEPGPSSWLHYGGSLAGDRQVELASVRKDTVSQLAVAWQYRTGDATSGDEYGGRPSRFKATPIYFDGKLVFSSGFNRVFAIDAVTGQQVWKFDPKVNFARGYSEMFTSRGVAAWSDTHRAGTPHCTTRIYLGTLDARLIAIDAADGRKCSNFGQHGEIDLADGIRKYRRYDYSLTSPPTVVGDIVVVGSSIGDNGAANLEPGVVRGFDARSGKLVWSWDPVPRSTAHPGADTWASGADTRTGAANVWSVMSGDPQRDLVFLPTTSPSPDFYGGKRRGHNAYANSIVALRASSGTFVWGYQTVHHDLWDYDIASQPLLFDFVDQEGRTVPALAQATKMGFVFVLHRETGKPLHPVEERAVPKSHVPGEEAAATQRFPRLRLHTTDARPLRLWDVSQEHRQVCEKMLEGVRYEGIFTPPSLDGTLLFPGNPGGTNWGSMAYDRGARIAFLTINRLPTVVKLIPRDKFARAQATGRLNGVSAQYTEQHGTPFGMARFELYNKHNNLPCLEGPWASLVAVDLNAGVVLWEKPAGVTPGIEDYPETADWGYYATGGPLVTASGVVFLTTPFDFMLRAYDGANGELLWQSQLPAGSHATPMGYRHDGRDYVVVTAGDRLRSGHGRGDFVIAFALPDADQDSEK